MDVSKDCLDVCFFYVSKDCFRRQLVHISKECFGHIYLEVDFLIAWGLCTYDLYLRSMHGGYVYMTYTQK